MSSGGHGRRRGKKHEEEEHENHERWLVSYADMMTLLLVLFVVLYAMSQVDKAKFAALASGLSDAFGTPVSASTSSSSTEPSVLDGLPAPADIALGIAPEEQPSQEQVDAAAAAAALAEAQQVAAEAQAQYEDLSEVRDDPGHVGEARDAERLRSRARVGGGRTTTLLAFDPAEPTVVSAGTTNRTPNASSRIAMVLIRLDLPEPMVPKMPTFGLGSSPARYNANGSNRNAPRV